MRRFSFSIVQRIGVSFVFVIASLLIFAHIAEAHCPPGASPHQLATSPYACLSLTVSGDSISFNGTVQNIAIGPFANNGSRGSGFWLFHEGVLYAEVHGDYLDVWVPPPTVFSSLPAGNYTASGVACYFNDGSGPRGCTDTDSW